MSYAHAKSDEITDTRVFREYVTESLRLKGENKYIGQRWIDIVRKEPEDSRTADEIAFDVITRAGLTMKGGEDK